MHNVCPARAAWRLGGLQNVRPTCAVWMVKGKQRFMPMSALSPLPNQQLGLNCCETGLVASKQSFRGSVFARLPGGHQNHRDPRMAKPVVTHVCRGVHVLLYTKLPHPKQTLAEILLVLSRPTPMALQKWGKFL